MIKPGDSLDDHAYDTISGSDWLADQDVVESFVEQAPLEMKLPPGCRHTTTSSSPSAGWRSEMRKIGN